MPGRGSGAGRAKVPDPIGSVPAHQGVTVVYVPAGLPFPRRAPPATAGERVRNTAGAFKVRTGAGSRSPRKGCRLTSKAAGVAGAGPTPAHRHRTPRPGSRDKMTSW
jgi:hypothetical protein